MRGRNGANIKNKHQQVQNIKHYRTKTNNRPQTAQQLNKINRFEINGKTFKNIISFYNNLV